MAITDQAPYAPASAVIKVLETYRDTGLGGRAVTEDLVAKLSVGDSIAPRVINALETLGLIDEDGMPTDDLVAFKQAASDAYRAVLAEILFNAYEPVFAITGRNLAEKSPGQIEDAFRSYRPDSLRKRMVTLFTGLCTYAGILAAAPTGKPGPKSGAHRQPPRADAGKRPGRRQKPIQQQSPLAPPIQSSQDVIFGVSEEDVAALSEEEFAAVWTALGTVARARARARAPQEDPAGSRTEEPEVDTS